MSLYNISLKDDEFDERSTTQSRKADNMSGEEGEAVDLENINPILKNQTRPELYKQNSDLDHDFEKKNGYSYDFCIVLKVDDGVLTPDGANILQRIHATGLTTKLFLSLQKDEAFVKIRASLTVLRKYADSLNFVLKLDHKVAKERIRVGDEERHIKGTVITHDPFVTKWEPFQHIFGKYDQSVGEDIYVKPGGLKHPFDPVSRIKIIRAIIEAPFFKGGANMKLRGYYMKKRILSYYPLHDYKQAGILAATVLPLNVMPWNLPLNRIRLYFGEKIGMYFSFLQHYTIWLIAVAVIGLAAQLQVFIQEDTNTVFVYVFAIIISCWAILMLEFWKRKEKVLAVKWGQTNYEEEELDRPEFRGEIRRSLIDGSEEKYFPPQKRQRREVLSESIITLLIIFVIAVVACIFIIRLVLVRRVSKTHGATIAAVINSVTIQVLNKVYKGIAVKLTDRENHRTDTNYEDSLIGKLYLFQFVNSYASFFYVAFIQHKVGGCTYSDCVGDLAYHLGIIFAVNLIVGNMTELLVPYIMFRLRERKETKGAEDKDQSLAEMEFFLERYDPIMATIEDYAELAIQFGFVVIFAAGFPLGAFLALLSNLVEIRGDMFKLLRIFQRPMPIGGEDIGTWQTIFQCQAIVAVVVNSAILCFTATHSGILANRDLSTRLWVFIVLQYIIFGLMFLLAILVPDIPLPVTLQLRRQEFIANKLISKIPDDDDDVDKIEVEMDPSCVNKPEFLPMDADDDAEQGNHMGHTRYLKWFELWRREKRGGGGQVMYVEKEDGSG